MESQIQQVLTVSNGVQLAITIASIGIAIIISMVFRNYFSVEKARERHKWEAQLYPYLYPLLAPMLALVLLSTGYVLVHQFNGEPEFLRGTTLLTMIWLVLRSVQVFTKNAFIKWLITLIIIPLVILNVFGLLDPIVTYLDGLAITIGTLKLSVYKILKSIVSIVVLLWLAGVAIHSSEVYIRRIHGIRSSNKELLIKILQVLIYFVIFILALDILGINLTALAVFSGAVGVGLGFGLQKISSNFISGLIMLFERSIELDDLVQLDSGIYGYIRHMGARHSVIETFDGREVMVPNEDFITQKVTNWTYSTKKGRVEFKVGVAYGSDLRLVQKLVLEAAAEHPRCSKDPAPSCFLSEFADSSVNFLLYFWVDDVTDGRLEPQSDVMFSIWEKFKEHNIEIPFPQRDIHIKTKA